MCGIFGYLSADPSLDEERVLGSAIEALWHRGPDDRGTFRGRRGRHRVGFAHTRLSILDLSPRGHQPMATADGRHTIVYNGEVYNSAEIRAELEKLGDAFVSSCDTEVVLKAYARWGPGALTRFRGMFALAIWDDREGSLFLARDRLGQKPLYYVSGPSGIAFASEVRALLATGFAERRLSRRALTSYFAFGAVSGPDVILEGVASLAPGHWLRWQDGELVDHEYWSLPLAPDREASFASEVRALRPILEEAVRLQLVADVPTGVFLSGGIDSSALVALATRVSAAPVHTFTVTFDEAGYDEAPFAAAVARRYDCENHQVRLPASEAVQHIGAAIRALDQPSSDGVNTYFVSKAARAAGLTVALSGLGGDEVFAGYGHFHDFGLLRAVARAAGRLPAGLHRGLGAGESLPFAPVQLRKLSLLLGGDGSSVATYAALRTMFTPAERRALLTGVVEEPGHLGVTAPGGLASLADDGRVGPVNAYSALELSHYLRHTLLRDTDAMSMAHSLEVRAPLLDHVLVERMMRVPGALKLASGFTIGALPPGPQAQGCAGRGNKPLLSGAVTGLPAAAVDRPKMGFSLPYDVWLRGPLRPWMEGLLLGDPVRRLGFLDAGRVETLWRSFLAGDRRTTFARVWCVAALVGWCDVNGVSDRGE